MGFISDLFQKLGGAAPKDLLFVPNLQVAGTTPEPLVEDECYVELYVESLRLSKARKLATKFQGVVYTFVDLPYQGDNRAKYAAVSKPDKLAALDEQSLDKVITVSRQMMGAAPWRGGSLHLELGLFSVKSGNLLTPIVDYVTRVSSTAGLSFVGAIKPFVPLLTEGMDILAGQAGDTAIEVGVETNLSPTTSGYYAVIDQSKTALDQTKLTIDPNDGKLLYDGAPLEAGYCVFSLRRALQKVDYGEIPDLKEKWAALQTAIRAGKMSEAKDALTAFRLATIASPDLITSDARALVAKAKAKVDEAFDATATAGLAEDDDTPLDALSSLELYSGG